MSNTNNTPPNPPQQDNLKSDNNSQSVPIAVATPTIAHVPHNNTTVFPNNLPPDFNPTNYTSTRYAEVPPENEVLNKCWQYGKSVKCFGILDGTICFFNALVIWPWIFLLIGPILGYKGAKEYCSKKSNAYLIFSSLMMLGRILLLVQIYNGSFSKDDKIMSSESQFLAWISLFARTWITLIIYKFSTMLGKLSEIELNTLQIGTYIPITTTILYY
jgi:hypothetical protein